MSQGKVEKFIPNPLEIAILLSFLVILVASLFAKGSLVENLGHWGSGLWSLLAFTTQISLILVGGFTLASSKPIKSLLRSLVTVPQSDKQAYLFTFVISALACWINWGLGLISGAFLAVEMAKRHKPINFPLLVACSYMGFLFWHGGMSGSIPLVVGTQGSFSESFTGGVIGLNETVFSSLNLIVICGLLLSLSILILYMSVNSANSHFKDWSTHLSNQGRAKSETNGLKSQFSNVAYWLLVFLFGAFLSSSLLGGSFSFGLNEVNFLLLFLSLVCHGSLGSTMASVEEACRKLAPILIQYPLYSGIMGVMVESGLAVQMSNFFVGISSKEFYSSLMFLSAGLVNFFVPSGGGQWAVQAPVVTEGARQLGVAMPKAVMAVAWGDAWTNLAQPFWALPLLSIAGLELKDILGYCLKALVVSGAVIFTLLLFF